MEQDKDEKTRIIQYTFRCGHCDAFLARHVFPAGVELREVGICHKCGKTSYFDYSEGNCLVFVDEQQSN